MDQYVKDRSSIVVCLRDIVRVKGGRWDNPLLGKGVGNLLDGVVWYSDIITVAVASPPAQGLNEPSWEPSGGSCCGRSNPKGVRGHVNDVLRLDFVQSGSKSRLSQKSPVLPCK